MSFVDLSRGAAKAVQTSVIASEAQMETSTFKYLAKWLAWSLLLAMLPLRTVSAEMLVQDLEGDAGQYQLLRDGQEQPLFVLSVLQAGDVVKLRSAQGRVTLVGEGGEVTVVDAGNSPFRIQQAEQRGWMDNALASALDWYRGVSAQQTEMVSLVTRDVSGGALQIQGMAARRNLVPVGMAPLHFRWSGGRGPFTVTVLDAKLRVVLQDTVSEPAFTARQSLPAGRYIVRVEGKGSEHEQRFTVTERPLPDAVLALDAQGLDSGLHEHLAAVMLARSRVWRFTALQFALRGDDLRLSQLLLSGQSNGLR